MADPKQVELLRQGIGVWNRYAQSVNKIDLCRANVRGAGCAAKTSSPGSTSLVGSL